MTLTNAPTANKKNELMPESKKDPGVRNYLEDLYEAQARNQKETLKQNYDKNMAKMQETQEGNRLRTDANLNRTNVESRKAGRNFNEIQNAYGLTSGAMAQANLARNNELAKDMTLLRLNQDRADANIERDKSLLGQLYASDQEKVDAARDAAMAEAIYKQQLAAGQLLADKTGDYTRLGEAYGLTPEEIQSLTPSADTSGYSGGWSWNDWIRRHRNESKPSAPATGNSGFYPVDRGHGQYWVGA